MEDAVVYNLDDYRRPSPEAVRLMLTGQDVAATIEDLPPGSNLTVELPGDYLDQLRDAAAKSGMTALELFANINIRGLALAALERQGYTNTCVKDTRSVSFKPLHELKNNP